MSLLKRIEQGQGSESGSKSQGGSKPSGSDSSRLSSLQTKRTNAPITSPQAGSYFDLKTRVQNKLLAELDPAMDITKTDEVKRTIQDLFEQILAEENIVLSRPERARLSGWRPLRGCSNRRRPFDFRRAPPQRTPGEASAGSRAHLELNGGGPARTKIP